MRARASSGHASPVRIEGYEDIVKHEAVAILLTCLVWTKARLDLHSPSPLAYIHLPSCQTLNMAWRVERGTRVCGFPFEVASDSRDVRRALLVSDTSAMHPVVSVARPFPWPQPRFFILRMLRMLSYRVEMHTGASDKPTRRWSASTRQRRP